MIVALTKAAEEDLEHIGDQIAEHDPHRAATFVRELVERCQTLAGMPERFVLMPRYENAGVRRFPFRGYLIFYRIEKDRVDILHILHGARDYEAILFPER